MGCLERQRRGHFLTRARQQFALTFNKPRDPLLTRLALCLVQPELHLHILVHSRGTDEGLLRLPHTPAACTELGNPEVAMSSKGLHSQFCGKCSSLPEKRFGTIFFG